MGCRKTSSISEISEGARKKAFWPKIRPCRKVSDRVWPGFAVRHPLHCRRPSLQCRCQSRYIAFWPASSSGGGKLILFRLLLSQSRFLPLESRRGTSSKFPSPCGRYEVGRGSFVPTHLPVRRMVIQSKVATPSLCEYCFGAFITHR